MINKINKDYRDSNFVPPSPLQNSAISKNIEHKLDLQQKASVPNKIVSRMRQRWAEETTKEAAKTPEIVFKHEYVPRKFITNASSPSKKSIEHVKKHNVSKLSPRTVKKHLNKFMNNNNQVSRKRRSRSRSRSRSKSANKP